jgi:Ca2+-binding EF-hand superfamily protein
LVSDARTYSGHVFDTLDKNEDGNVTFEQFLVAMSVISRGSLEEKLRWVFNLYDINGDGFISPDEMEEIVKSVYEMLGKRVHPSIEDDTAQEHADRIFRVRRHHSLPPHKLLWRRPRVCTSPTRQIINDLW